MMAGVVEDSLPGHLEDHEQQFTLIAQIELGIALLATVLIAGLHVVCLMNNPALWRDEVAALNLSQVSSLQKYWELCEFDSSFAVWFVALRGWVSIFGSSDLSLRLLGTGIGLVLLGVCWWIARKFHCKHPLLTLSLFCLNTSVIYWGDTIRGYGLGTIFLLIMLGQTWRFAQDATWRNLLLALIPALLAVHTLYYNCIFLFAMCMGVTAVLYRTRNWRGIVQILGLGFVCAVTMLVYVDPILRVGKWRSLVFTPLSTYRVVELFTGAGGHAAYVLDAVWAILVPVTPVILGLFAFMKWRSSELHLADRALFLLVTYCTGLTGFLILLFGHGYQPQPWHFIPILGFVTIPIEAALMDGVRYSEAGRKLRLYFVLAFWLLVSYSTLVLVEGRRTNVEVATAEVNRNAKPGDLVVIQPWYIGISFRHYHTSPADWVAVPGMRGDELLVHRWDVLRDLMHNEQSITEITEQINATLKSGHTVWYLGNFSSLNRDQPLPTPPVRLTSESTPSSLNFLTYFYYLRYWSQYFYRHLEDHSAICEDVHIGSFHAYGFENARLVKASIWHEKKPD